MIRVGESVKVLASLDDGRPVAVQQDNLLATAFHPELTRDSRVHQYFVSLAERPLPHRTQNDFAGKNPALVQNRPKSSWVEE